jgi:hypothetical protein
MILSRRGVLRCLTGLIAAPAIVRADSLMRVVTQPSLRTLTEREWFDAVVKQICDEMAEQWLYGNPDQPDYFPGLANYIRLERADV